MIAFVLYGASAVLCLVTALVVLPSRNLVRRDRGAIGTALMATALWCGAAAALGEMAALTRVLETVRNLGWIYALFRHFANDGRDESLRGVRQVATALMSVEALQFLLVFSHTSPNTVELVAVLRMLVAVGAMVLVHNLYGGASEASRRLLGWNSAALALFWGFELNLYTIAYLSGAPPAGLEGLRAIVIGLAAAAFALGALQGGAGLTFRPSRAVTLSTLSLAILAVYFLAMVALASGAARLSGDLARVTQVGFLLLAATAALIWLPSPRLRGTARVLALKHLFKHRYDYREEWLRFTRTIGGGAAGSATLHERAIQSLADITDSGAGVLLTPQDDGDLELAARWRWPTLAVPARAIPPALARIFEAHKLILDLDEVRAGIDHFGEQPLVPEWLRQDQAVWAAVPLLHGERLVGVIVLARPQVARRLDWEDFDLLAVAGQQVASYLSEQAGQEALQDAERFEEFSRRMAFVMHDIKNLSSQLSLLARNAERHAENPEFRKDMLVTIRNSADKLAALVTRLGRYGGKGAVTVAPFDLASLAMRVAQRFAPLRTIDNLGEAECRVTGNEEMLEQALMHLVQNAIEASEPHSPIALEVDRTALWGTIAVVDSGRGMSPQFVRSGLFRPFVSTKESGFGIGVCEARDHARMMGGRLDVESREGLGSRFTISLPRVDAARLISRHSTTQIEEAA